MEGFLSLDNANIDFNPVKIMIQSIFNASVASCHPEKQTVSISKQTVSTGCIKI